MPKYIDIVVVTLLLFFASSSVAAAQEISVGEMVIFKNRIVCVNREKTILLMHTYGQNTKDGDALFKELSTPAKGELPTCLRLSIKGLVVEKVASEVQTHQSVQLQVNVFMFNQIVGETIAAGFVIHAYRLPGYGI